MSSGLPLEKYTILVTRAAEQSSGFTSLLQQQGARVIELPALEIQPPSTWEPLDAAIRELDSFDWLVLTSANGVDSLHARLTNAGRSFGGVKIAVVGKKTAATLQRYGTGPDFIPPDYIADALVSNFPDAIEGKRILFPRVETGGREILVKEFRSGGAEVVEVPAYESGCPESMDEKVWSALRGKEVDIITFASSKTVQNFSTLLKRRDPDFILTGVTIGSIGPQTSKTCYELFGRVDIEASEYTLEGLTEAILDWAGR